MADKVVIPIDLDLNKFEQDLNKIQTDLKKFNTKTRSQAKLKMQINLAQLQSDLAKAQALVRKYRKEGDKQAEIKASLKVQGLQANIKKAKSSLKTLNDSTKKTSSGFTKLNGIAKGFLQALGISAAIGAVVVGVKKLANALISSGKAAVSFERAFTGVRKTVNGSTSELKSLEKEFRNLAKEIPLPVEELAKIGELGGQLGVAKEELIDFTKTVAAIGVSTNLSTEEAATALSRIGNIFGKGAKDVDRYGATIVDLGNNMATTEKEITNFTTNIAAAGKVVGLSEADLFGIGAAFTSVGVEAEAGGTAVQKVLFDINSAVSKGGEEMDRFASVSGMSSADFKKAWKTDAAKTFQAFVNGLGTAGADADTILTELVGDNARLKKGFLSVASAGDLMSESITRANSAFKNNTALLSESEKFYADAKSQIQLYKNEVNDLKISIGNALLKGFLPLIKGLKRVVASINTFISNGERMKGIINIIKLAAVALAVSFANVLAPLIAAGVTIYGLIKTIAPLIDFLFKLSYEIGRVVKKLVDIAAKIPVVTGTLKVLGEVVGWVGSVFKAWGDNLNNMLADLQKLIDTDEEAAARAKANAEEYTKAQVKKAFANGETVDSMLKDVAREKKALADLVSAQKKAQGEERQVLNKKVQDQKDWIETVLGELTKATKESGTLGETFSTAFAEASTSSQMLRILKKAGVDVSNESLTGVLQESIEFQNAGQVEAALFAYGIKGEIPEAVKGADELRAYALNALQIRKAELLAIHKNTQAAGKNFVNGIISGLSDKVPALSRLISSISKLLGTTATSLKRIGSVLPDVGGIKSIAVGLSNAFSPALSEIKKIDAANQKLIADSKASSGAISTVGGGGGGGVTAKKVDDVKRLADATKDFNDELKESVKRADDASNALEDMYDGVFDTIQNALIAQKELNDSLDNFKEESQKSLVEKAGQQEVENNEEIKSLTERIIKLKQDLNKEGADTQSINENIAELEGERNKLNADLQSIQEFRATLSEDELVNLEKVIKLEKARNGAAGEFQLAQIDTQASIDAKDAEVKAEVAKQQAIIDIQNKFLEISASKDADVIAKKQKLEGLLTATTQQELEKRALLLKELGFSELTANEELALAKQIAKQTELQQNLDAEILNQQSILEAKKEFLSEFETANKESLDTLKAETDSLIKKYDEAIKKLRDLMSLQEAAKKDGLGLGSSSDTDQRSYNIVINANNGVDIDELINNTTKYINQ